MKSLDEVIELNENILTFAYLPKDDTTTTAGLSLFYLREYREIKNHLACMNNAEIRGDSTQIINNPPLTWDELKQMEGKPVWIEGTHHKHWCIIKGIARKDLSEMEYITLAYLNNKNRIVTYDRRKGNFDVTWQAYRKETI